LRAGSAAAVFAVAAVCVCGDRASAHRRDELLQAARVAVERNRVELELDLTPGIAVADAVIADIDRDRDGSLSADERDGYAARVMRAIDLSLDGGALDVRLLSAAFPEADAFRRGEGTIRLRSAVVLPRVADGDHRLAFRNGYRRDVSAYLANALAPQSDRIGIVAQRRDAEQRELTIEYVARGGAPPSLWLLGGIAGIVLAFAALRTIPKEDER
jgi:hypothetical protein